MRNWLKQMSIEDELMQLYQTQAETLTALTEDPFRLEKEIQTLFESNLSLYTTNFTEPLSYQGSAFLKLPKFP